MPIGYAQVDVIAGCAAVSFNTFPTFRGARRRTPCAPAGGHALRFRCERVQHRAVSTCQGNDEGIATGAWWFYYKLGFRPRAAAPRRIARAELGRIKVNPRHRSSPATLRKLAEGHLFFELESAHPRGLPPVAALGERVAAQLARYPAADRAGALTEASRAMMRLAGMRSLRGFTPNERLAWRRWSPFLLALPGLPRWSAADRRAVARIVRAKGGRRESDFATLFAAHPRLARALFALHV